MLLTPCWPPPVITSISCLGGWSSCCLDSWRLRTQRPPFNGSENRKLHGRLISEFPIKATQQRAEGPLPSQSKKCETTTDRPRLHANLDRGHWMPLGPIAGDRLHPDLSRRAFRT